MNTSLTVLGYSPPYPNPSRATSSYLVHSPATAVLVDCGHGAASKLCEAVDLATLDAIVISHMHPDHFYDLVALRNLFLHSGLDRRPLLLPRDGAHLLAAVIEATGLPSRFMTEFFDVDEFPSEFEIGDIQVVATPTVHPIPTFALRIAGPGGVIGYTSDTAWSDTVLEAVRGVDVLLVEATDFPLVPKGQRWHLSPEEAIALARGASARSTVVTHYDERHRSALHRCLRACADGLVVALAEEFLVMRLDTETADA